MTKKRLTCLLLGLVTMLTFVGVLPQFSPAPANAETKYKHSSNLKLSADTDFLPLRNSDGDIYTWAEYSSRYLGTQKSSSGREQVIYAYYDELQIYDGNGILKATKKFDALPGTANNGLISVSGLMGDYAAFTPFSIAVNLFGDFIPEGYTARLTVRAEKNVTVLPIYLTGDYLLLSDFSKKNSTFSSGSLDSFNGELLNYYCLNSGEYFGLLPPETPDNPNPPDVQPGGMEGYSGVLADLRKDSSFRAEDYPARADDYSISVIQVAESTAGELFVYAYQPCYPSRPLIATQINMSQSTSVDDTRLRSLTLVNCSGVFVKYRVEHFEKLAGMTRYYNITSIYRPWDAAIDEPGTAETETNQVAFAVGRLFKAEDTPEGVKYSCTYVETIEIISPFVDFLEYSNGFQFYPTWCRSHYIAFSTDRRIDKLMEADVYYVSRKAIKRVHTLEEITYEDPVEHIETICGEDKGGNAADGWFSKKYEWNRIQSVSEFIAGEKLTDKTKENLKGKTWVLRFAETEITRVDSPSGIIGSSTTYYTDISQVTILRLKFITAGKTYNLGAVSNQVTGDDNPGNTNTNELDFFGWLERITGVPQWVWKALAVIIPLAILLPVLSAIFPVVGEILKKVFQGLWWLICLPFRGIKALIDRSRSNSAPSQSSINKRRGR